MKRMVCLISVFIVTILILVGSVSWYLYSTNEKHKTLNVLFPFTQKGRIGFMDKTGKIVIEPKFYEAHRFMHGLAAVKINNSTFGWGYIDTKGNIVIPPKFTYAGDFFFEDYGGGKIDDGIRWNKEFWIDRNGNEVDPPDKFKNDWLNKKLAKPFEERFYNGLLPFSKNGLKTG